MRREEIQQLLRRSPCTCRAHGSGERERLPIRVGSHRIHCTRDWLCPADGWVRKHQTDNGQRPGQTTEDRERIKALERENRELCKANGILRLASAYFAQAEPDWPAPRRRNKP